MRSKKPLPFALPLLAAAALSCSAQAQIWNKRVAPGLEYRMQYDPGGPWAIHVLRFISGSTATFLRPELAQGVVYTNDSSDGCEPISAMVTRTKAIAGINGDFFPFTGQVLGGLVRDGQILSSPGYPRAVFAWGPGGGTVGEVKFAASAEWSGGSAPVLGLNRTCQNDDLVLNTSAAGIAQQKGQGICLVLDVGSAVWSPDCQVQATVKQIVQNAPAEPIAQNQAALVATGTRAAALQSLKVGDSIKLSVHLTGLDWSQVRNVIGGGPFLIRGGKLAIDWQAEAFKPAFATARHPRTAIGKTADGDILLVAIEGGCPYSVGATLDEEARILLRLGCVDAINLDGGGSTTFNLRGLTLNRPSDGVERKVASGVLVFDTQTEPVDDAPPTIQLPAQVKTGQNAQLSLLDSNRHPIDNAQVIWSASGAAWIDQGGMLHPLSTGSVTVSAYAHGRTATATLAVQD